MPNEPYFCKYDSCTSAIALRRQCAWLGATSAQGLTFWRIGVRFRLFSRETRITKLYLEVFINKIACNPIKTYAIRY